MPKKPPLSRREFLHLSAVATASVVLASCVSGASPTPIAKSTATPDRVTEQDQPTPIPQALPTETPIPTAIPAQQAPALAAKVAVGELPPLVERLPKVPLTLAPLNKVGSYGGRLRFSHAYMGYFTSECMYGHSPLRWIDDTLGIAPGICDAWGTDAENKTWTLHLREGLRWSDGQPCTTADVLFWWQDMVLDLDCPEQPPDFGRAGGELAEFSALDEETLQIKYSEPAPLTAKRLAMWVNGDIGPRWIAPAHFLKQFHPRYNSAYTNFETFNARCSASLNPEMPSLNPWVLTSYMTDVACTWERNLYYYAVDILGDQLPYIDGIDETSHSDRQMAMLKIMQGAVDFTLFTYEFTPADIAPLKDAEEKGNYEVRLYDNGSGTGQMYMWNYDSQEDKRRELYRNSKFKQAMSFAIDRPTIQRVVYYQTGMLTGGTLSPKAIEFNLNAAARAHYLKFRDLYAAYDPEKAKELLDEISVVDVNGDGWREFPDGSPLVVRVDYQAAAARKETIDVLEIATQNWQDIGLNIVINQMPDADFSTSWPAGKLDFATGGEASDGPDHLLYPGMLVPNDADHWAPLCGNMLVVQGTPVDGTDRDISPWERKPPRWQVDEPGYAGTPVEKLHQLYEKARIETDEIKRMEYVWEMNEIHMQEGPFFIGTVCNTPRIVIVSKNLENVPTRQQLKLNGFCNPWIVAYPAITNPETYFFKIRSDV
jgi:peptide/nickel transport system substrate-binding protein